MLLAIDCGNSEFKIGLFEGERLAADWRLTTRPDQTADELGALLRQLFELRGVDLAAVDGVVIASVVPSFNRALVEASRTYLNQEPLMVGPGIKTGVRVRIENPKEVGADRIANSLAAFHRYGGPVVVIDIGTALTYDAVSAEGDYLGGAIAPGLQVALDALVQNTARLSRVELSAPASVIGRTTVTAIQSGLMWGLAGAIEGMVARFRAELGDGTRIVATGGHARLMASLTPVIEETDPLLTLEGLRLIWAQNQEPGGSAGGRAAGGPAERAGARRREGGGPPLVDT